MPVSSLYDELKSLLQGRVLLQEPMSLHTSWRIGGPADIFAEPAGVEDLRQLFKSADDNDMPLTVIGAGTNILVRDGGINGIVLKAHKGPGITVEGSLITCAGGVRLSRLTSTARDACLGGFEFLAGIPGTVGGAVIMNAGANGSSASRLIEKVTCIDYEGNLLCLEKGQIEWGYRKSGLQGKYLAVVEVVFRGYPQDRDMIILEMKKYMNIRKDKQPLEYPNAGSVFKNPPGEYAGKLIQDAGCQGLRVGDAQVSTKHANFIINLGKARAVEVLELISIVRERVFTEFGTSLEMEVKVLGRD